MLDPVQRVKLSGTEPQVGCSLSELLYKPRVDVSSGTRVILLTQSAAVWQVE